MKRLTAIVALLVAAPAYASIGTVLNDDAAVTERGALRLDSWVQADRRQFEHWVFGSVGAARALELSIGGTWGAAYHRGARIGAFGPVLQAKVALVEARENRWPGAALVAGVASPYDTAEFGPAGWTGFFYAATTQKGIGTRRLSAYGNVGFTATRTGHATNLQPIGGVELSFELVKNLSGIVEAYHRDSFAVREGGALQGGLRWQIRERVTLDGMAGGGIWGRERQAVWGALGVRVDSSPLW